MKTKQCLKNISVDARMFIMGGDFKGRFLTVFSNLPIGMRNEIIAVVNDQPIKWNVAYEEIIKDTKVGKEILDKLVEMELI